MLLGTKSIDPPYPVSAILNPVIKDGLKQCLEYDRIDADDPRDLFC